MSRFLIAMVVLLTFWLAPVLAQLPATPAVPPPGEAQSERPAPPLPWVLAFLGTAGILVIVCMPSRKSE
jgi:hypothetical protein